MELRSTVTTCFFLFLVLALPPFSRAGGSGSETLSSEIYEIDYRGPETHSSVPPPDHSHGKPFPTNRKTSAGEAKAMATFMGTSTHKEEKLKEVHG